MITWITATTVTIVFIVVILSGGRCWRRIATIIVIIIIVAAWRRITRWWWIVICWRIIRRWIVICWRIIRRWIVIVVAVRILRIWWQLIAMVITARIRLWTGQDDVGGEGDRGKISCVRLLLSPHLGGDGQWVILPNGHVCGDGLEWSGTHWCIASNNDNMITCLTSICRMDSHP